MQESFIPAVERTLQLIEMIAKTPQGYTPQELLSMLDVPRSTLFQMLKTLKQMGYIEQSEKRGRYRRGPRLDQWANPGSPSLAQDLVSLFYAETSRHPFDETIALITQSSGQYLVTAQVEAHRQVRSSYNLGPWEGGASLPAVLFSPPAGHELLQYGVSVLSTTETLECIAPVCQDGVTPSAMLLVTAPGSRYTEMAFRKTYANEVRSMASRLSYQLGAQVYTPYRQTENANIQGTTELDIREINKFLQGPWSARLACVRPDGRPHVVPVWQEWNGRQFTILAWKGSYWANYLKENPNVSLTIDEPWPPFHRVVVQGIAAQVPGLDKALVEGMSKRYMGSAIPDLLQSIAGVYQITPEQLKGWKGIAGV